MKALSGLAVVLALTAVPGTAPTPTGSEQELLKVEHAWSQAVVNRDGAALQRFYAEEYVFTDADGIVTNKSQEMKNITSGSFRLSSYKFDDVRVRVYGEVAVVVGQNTIKGGWEDITRDVSGPYRFTDVFVSREGRWQCVASQASRIAEK